MPERRQWLVPARVEQLDDDVRVAVRLQVGAIGGVQGVRAVRARVLARQAQHLRPPYPCHYYMHGAGKYGLQCLCNLDLLPPTGALIVAAPLKILDGSGSPLRVFALVPSGRG